jgi:hypothetical protein
MFMCHVVLSYYVYSVLAEMPGVARVDHRTKCVSLEASKEIYPRNGPQRKYQLGKDPKENTTPLLSLPINKQT